MTAAPVTIVCANCGAKYKLPADFKAATAKCKSCGATIDVAGQMRAAAAPPKAATHTKPAAPARAASAAAPSTSSRRERSRASSASNKRAGGSASRRTRPESGERAENKGGSKAVLVGSVVALVGIGVAGFFLLTGGDKPATTGNQAAAAAPDAKPVDAAMAKASDAAPNAVKDAVDAGKKSAAQATGATPATGTPAGQTPATESASMDKPADAKAARAKTKAETPKAADAPKKELTLADVFDPSTLPPLEYPDYVDQALRDEIASLCDDVKNGGRPGVKAKQRLEQIGHPAIVGVVNAYQKIDFKNPDQAMYAFELNKLLTHAFGAGVINADFKPTQAGDPIPLDIADWNAKTVNTWRRFWEKHRDKDAWEAMMKKRKEGKGGEGEDK